MCVRIRARVGDSDGGDDDDAMTDASGLSTGLLSPAGFAVVYVSLVGGLLAALLGPWSSQTRAAALRGARPCSCEALLCLCGGDPVVFGRALTTGACTAWFLFALFGTVQQTFAEAACADVGAALTAADLGTAATCVRVVRALVWSDQRALAFGAYLAAALMCALVMDARASNALVAAGVSTCACALLGTDRALPDPHERVGVAVGLGLLASIAWGWLVTARVQAVVHVPPLVSVPLAAPKHRQSQPQPQQQQYAVPPPQPLPASKVAEYGDTPAHVWALTVFGAVAANMAAWLLYWNGRTAADGWPVLVEGAAEHTWAAIVPGAVVGIAWAAAKPPLCARVRDAMAAHEAAARERRAARARSARSDTRGSDGTPMATARRVRGGSAGTDDEDDDGGGGGDGRSPLVDRPLLL